MVERTRSPLVQGSRQHLLGVANTTLKERIKEVFGDGGSCEAAARPAVILRRVVGRRQTGRERDQRPGPRSVCQGCRAEVTLPQLWQQSAAHGRGWGSHSHHRDNPCWASPPCTELNLSPQELPGSVEGRSMGVTQEGRSGTKISLLFRGLNQHKTHQHPPKP